MSVATRVRIARVGNGYQHLAGPPGRCGVALLGFLLGVVPIPVAALDRQPFAVRHEYEVACASYECPVLAILKDPPFRSGGTAFRTDRHKVHGQAHLLQAAAGHCYGDHSAATEGAA